MKVKHDREEPEKCLIELWKTNCPDCEAAKPIVAELEKEGFVFEKYNIESPEGQRLWEEYLKEIEAHNEKRGYEQGYIYTPTFINPKTRAVLAYPDHAPTKEELVKLVE